MARGSFDATDLIAPLMLRIPLGLIFMAHGSQKLLGLFGGKGLTATFANFERDLGIPAIFTLLAIIAEFGGGFGVLTGFLTRLSAAGISAVMLVEFLGETKAADRMTRALEITDDIIGSTDEIGDAIAEKVERS